MEDFSDYIFFVDESGIPNLEGIDSTFPVFTLAFIAIEKNHYADVIVPTLQKFKMRHLGHDQIILHERDIRRQSNQFSFLQVDPDYREAFLKELTETFDGFDIGIISTTIQKQTLKRKYARPYDPYEIALFLCLEQVQQYLISKRQENKTIHVIFESRGKPEDNALELEFRRITNNSSQWGHRNHDFTRLNWKILFASKKSNSSGLQLADLVARPIALSHLRPDQPNRAFEKISDLIIDRKYFP